MLQKIKPQVNKKWLLLISGGIWSIVGILLNRVAYKWYIALDNFHLIVILVLGIVLALLITWFGFRKVVEKNIRRILSYPEWVCIFAFQDWKSYILIAVMMSMGFYLRTASIVPKFVLAPGYVGIGTALFLSSFGYYKKYFSYKKNHMFLTEKAANKEEQ